MRTEEAVAVSATIDVNSGCLATRWFQARRRARKLPLCNDDDDQSWKLIRISPPIEPFGRPLRSPSGRVLPIRSVVQSLSSGTRRGAFGGSGVGRLLVVAGRERHDRWRRNSTQPSLKPPLTIRRQWRDRPTFRGK